MKGTHIRVVYGFLLVLNIFMYVLFHFKQSNALFSYVFQTSALLCTGMVLNMFTTQVSANKPSTSLLVKCNLWINPIRNKMNKRVQKVLRVSRAHTVCQCRRSLTLSVAVEITWILDKFRCCKLSEQGPDCRYAPPYLGQPVLRKSCAPLWLQLQCACAETSPRLYCTRTGWPSPISGVSASWELTEGIPPAIERNGRAHSKHCKWDTRDKLWSFAVFIPRSLILNLPWGIKRCDLLCQRRVLPSIENVRVQWQCCG